MKIIQLKAENIKNLKAVEITPDGEIVKLTGKNGAGKSAILDAIFAALTGTTIEDPIRHGEDRAEVNIDLGDLRIRKIWTPKGARLEVTNAAGDVKKTPQTILSEIFGKLSFDPLAFQTMPSKKQIDVLKDLAGLNFEDLEKEYAEVFQQRTGLNSKVREVIAQIENSEAPDPNTPDEEISFKDELDKVNILREKKRSYDAAVDAVSYKTKAIDDFEDEIQEKEEKIEILQRDIAEIQEALELEIQRKKDLESKIPPAITQNEIEAANESLKSIEDKNVEIRAAARYRKHIREADKLKKESDALTQRLERISQDKATRISNADLIVPGLSLGEDYVLYNGTPFMRLSTGEQIRISTAIAMRLNPQLKVIIIREGSLVDSDGIRAIAEQAAKEGGEEKYQIWIESVAEIIEKDGKKIYPAGIYIEDGSIRAINGLELQPAVIEEAEEIEGGIPNV